MYDLIGDIHGHASELVKLLAALGYSKQKGVYKHPERQAIFLGDFIDRGPQIRETLEIVRPMIDSGCALSVMGNCHSALQNRPRIGASKPAIGWVVLAGIILLCGPIGKWSGFSR